MAWQEPLDAHASQALDLTVLTQAPLESVLMTMPFSVAN